MHLTASPISQHPEYITEPAVRINDRNKTPTTSITNPMQLRNRTRSAAKLPERSKYFQAAKAPRNSPKRSPKRIAKSLATPKVEIETPDVDIAWVKSLNNHDYFNWVAERTGNVAHRWDSPLPANAFTPLNGHSLPRYFKEIYLKLRRLRGGLAAPVDTVGGSSVSITVAEQLGIPKSELEPRNYRLQTLIGIMLSSQTKDEVTAKAMYNITEYCLNTLGSRGISLDAMLQIDEPTLDSLIRQVGFHTRKATYITQTCRILVDRFDSEIPTTPQGMLSLPGVGPKMTYLTLQKTWGRMDGICVDVHVDRFCKLFKWVDPKKCKNPNDTREALQEWLPLPLWREINSLLVGYGQAIDRPRAKVCELCATPDEPFVPGKPNSHNHICPRTADPELLEMVPYMKNYPDWVNFLIRDAKKRAEVAVKPENDEPEMPLSDAQLLVQDHGVKVEVPSENDAEMLGQHGVKAEGVLDHDAELLGQDGVKTEEPSDIGTAVKTEVKVEVKSF